MTFHRHSSVARRLAGAIKQLRFLVRMQHCSVHQSRVVDCPPPPLDAKSRGNSRTHAPQSKRRRPIIYTAPIIHHPSLSPLHPPPRGPPNR